MDFSIENKYFKKGYTLIAGVDEVGRGAVAGPLFVGLAIFCKPLKYTDIFWKDSKLYSSEKLRQKVFMKLMDIPGLVWQVGWVDAWEIDKNGITWALGEALNRALNKLNKKFYPEVLLVDGKSPFPGINIPQVPIIRGDKISPSIAAASIIAKVIRDVFVSSISDIADYGVNSNKGYGTKGHLNKIEQLGLTSWHRKSFLRRYIEEGDDYA